MKNFLKQLISFILVAGILVGAYFVLDNKTNIFDKLFSREYEVTWVVEGKETTKKYVYGTTPQYDGMPAKEPTTTIEYVFDGWEPAVQTVSRTPAKYTAKFKEQTRLYSVTIASNYPNGAEYTGTGKIYEYQDDASVTISPNFGYNFLGWFDGSGAGATKIYEPSKTTLNFEDITADITLYPKFETIKYTAIYNNLEGAANTNKTTLDAADGVYAFKNLSKAGYAFNGWFKESTCINRIEELDFTTDSLYLIAARANSNTFNLYAKWTIITYNISYNLNGGSVESDNPTTYNVETATFTLNNPTKTDCDFLGWIGTGLNERTTSVTISVGSTGDRVYTACYDDERAITLVVEGQTLTDDVVIVHYNVPVASLPEIDYSNYGMGGYTVNKWYTDSACTSEQTFPLTPTNDITLYGKWQYFMREGFYKYKDKFDARITGSSLTINSYEELEAWVEYIEFNYITNPYDFSFGYTPEESKDADMAKAIDNSFYARNCTVSRSTGAFSSTISLTENNKNTEGKQHVNVTSGQHVQQAYAFKLTYPNNRAEDYSFNIDKVSKTLNVETSNQLVYALEMGLKPVCKAGSTAETVYNAARNVLRQIISDDMDDITKLRAIYEWLIYNVEYDYTAAEDVGEINHNWKNYDSWFAEGVFVHHKAVCDGFAKAFNIMAQIENIPSIRISGSQHAWNKVYVGGHWYGVDATHGNLSLNGDKEIVNYAQFMFTDEFKEGRGCVASNHTNIVANTLYCYYENAAYTQNSTQFDLLINSQNELDLAVKYAVSNKVRIASETQYTIDFVFAAKDNNNNTWNYADAVSHAVSNANYSTILNPKTYMVFSVGSTTPGVQFGNAGYNYALDTNGYVLVCLVLQF